MIHLGKPIHLYCPDGTIDWMKTHASQPFAQVLDNDIVRIYFSTRNENQVSSIGFIDILMRDPYPVVNISSDPVLSSGAVGLFDDSGVSMGSIVNWKGTKYLYYLGWNLRVTVPWCNTIGLAVLDSSKGEFKKAGRVPIMDRSEEDPFSMSYPFVMEDDERLCMWYGTNLAWGESKLDMQHCIRFAESNDGFTWRRSLQPALIPDGTNEIGYSRPVVLKDKELYRMWFSIRMRSEEMIYRIGYAESADAIHWIKKEELYPNIPSDNWNHEMSCYPFVFKHKDQLFMLMNGNGYGKTGIGLVELI